MKPQVSEDALTLALVLVERFGLDGLPPRSIAEVAERYGLTRLDVRFLEIKGLLLMKSSLGSKVPS